MGPNNFLKEAHPKLRPVETLSAGIYLAGAAQAPKDIPETVAQSGCAAVKVAALFSSSHIENEPTVAVVDPDVCAACQLCVDACPYGAREKHPAEAYMQVNEMLFLHKGLGRQAARARTLELLELVGLPEGEKRLAAYPHQLSGGQRQRVMIAMALANEPDLLIADEPTTALDVTIQAQILELLKELQEDLGMSILFITHDLGVVAEVADEVVVMYASKIVEKAAARELFGNPMHPYTVGLFGSRPSIDRSRADRLPVIPGQVPNPTSFPTGCKFHPRCTKVFDPCAELEPVLIETAREHGISCHQFGSEGRDLA